MKRLFKLLLLPASISLAYATTSAPSTVQEPSAASTTGETTLASPYPDFFHIPIWGLRVGGAPYESSRGELWEYFRAGRGILKVSPATINFGTVTIGDKLTPDAITLKNVGAAPLKIDKVAAPHQYEASDHCNDAVLPPLATCIFTVRLVPVDTKSASGFVKIPFSGDGASAIANVTLTATVQKPKDKPSPGASLGEEPLEPGAPLPTYPEDDPRNPEHPDYKPPVLEYDEETQEYVLVFPPPIYLGDDFKYRTFRLHSNGKAALQVNAIDIEAGSNFYVSTHDCPTVLPIGAFCDITVRLNPLEVGDIHGSMLIRSTSHDDSSIRVRIYANVSEWIGRLQYSETVDWGIVDRGYASTRTVTVKNSGNLPLTGIKVVPEAPYTLTGNTCNAGNVALAPDDTCTWTFSMSSNSDGDYRRVAKVTANELTHAAPDLNLVSKVGLRQGVFSPGTMSFGLRDMAKLSAPIDLTFTNTGTLPVRPNFGSLTKAGEKRVAYGTDYLVVNGQEWLHLNLNTCNTTIQPGASCVAKVAVQPTATSYQSYNWVAYPDTGMTVRGTTLNANTTGTKQSFVYTPTAVSLGVVNGVETVSGGITVTNTSLDDTTLTGFSLSVTQPTQGRGTLSTTGTTCASSLTTAAGTCTINVTLTGASLTKDEAQVSNDGFIQFRYSGADTVYTKVPVDFVLQGNTLEITDDGLDFGDIPVGMTSADALAKMPRRLITVKNPGPAAATLSDIVLNNQTYGLTLQMDTAYENSCTFNKAIPAGSTCVIALYPVSDYRAEFGQMSNNLQLYTTINGVRTAIGPQMTAKANHLTPVFEFEREVRVLGGEQTQTIYEIPFKMNYEGRIGIYSSSYSNSPNVHSQVTSTCQNKVITKDDSCVMQVVVAHVANIDEVPHTANFYINQKNTSYKLDAVDFKSTLEMATFSVSEAEWNAGDQPAQLINSEKPEYTKRILVTNTSERATLRFQNFVYDSLWYTTVTGAQTIDGKSYPNCYYAVVTPGNSCVLVPMLSPTANNANIIGAYSGNFGIQANNRFAKVEIPVQVNLLPGDLEIVQMPEHFQDTPAATVSNPQSIILRNNGQGNIRWAVPVTGKSYSNYFNIYNDDREAGIRLQNGSVTSTTISYSSSTGSGVHKTAESAPELLCLNYLGLAPGASCSMPVVHAPTAESRSYDATFFAGANLPERKTVTDTLSANSVAAELYRSSDFFVFPDDMRVGTEYRSQIVLGNGGNYPLNITNIIRQGGFPETETRLEHNCEDGVLQPGEECTLEFILVPDKNHNWGTTSPLQSVRITHSTRGVPANVTFNLKGISLGSYVTATPLLKTGILAERENFPAEKMYDIELKNVGDAPFRIISHRATGHTSGDFVHTKEGTCVVGTTFQPGESCVFQVWTNSNYSTLSSYFNNPQFTPFTINGTHVDENNSTVVDKAVRVGFTGSWYYSNKDFEVYPSVMPSNKSLPLTVVLDSYMQPNTVVAVDSDKRVYDQPTPAPYARTTDTQTIQYLEHEYKANNTVRKVPFEYKGPGFSAKYTKELSAESFNMLLPGESTAPVYSAATTTPALPKGQVPLYRTPLANGGELFMTVSGSNFSVHTTNRYGQLISTKMLQNTNSYYGITGVESGSFSMGPDGVFRTLFAYYTMSYWSYEGRSSWSYSYVGVPVEVSVSATGEITTATVDNNNRLSTGSVSGGSHYTDYQMHVHNAYLDPENGDAVALSISTQEYYSNLTYGGSIQISGRSNGVNFSRYFYSNSPLGNSVQAGGVLIRDGYVYLRRDTSIYTFEIKGSTLGDPVRFEFPEGLTANGGHMTFNRRASSIILPCYENRAICSIPAREGGLGLMTMEIGNETAAGRSDGASEARMSINPRYISQISADGATIGFVSSLAPFHPRVARVSGIPAFGSVGAQNFDFELQVNAENVAQPHTIRLQNQGGVPLNVTGVSDPSITFTSTCDNTPYLGECAVTVQIPYSLWSTANEGTFNLLTSASVMVPVYWRLPEAAVAP